VSTPGIVDQIHELFFEERPISAKPISEQLGISRVRVSSIIHENLDMSKLSSKRVPNARTRIKNVNGVIRLSKFGIFTAQSK
jgi:DNA-binding transcriptional regulator GbsR (MarR family)